MIYYFSGTGNSKWVAEQLALKTNDIAVNMVGLKVVPSTDGQTLGIVFPIYAWGIPEPVLEFVKRLHGLPAFTFGACTCGDEAGNAMQKLSRIIALNSSYSISMPSNYIIGSDVESNENIASKISKAKEKIETIAAQIIAKQSIHDVNKGQMAWIKTNLANFGFNMAARSTKPFYVTDMCISCGECAKNCPANSISLVDGKPRWGEKCYQCTSCINRCPTQAIENGKNTATRGRYKFTDNQELTASIGS